MSSLDVLVVGAGFSGLVSAILSKQLGLSVVVLEKRAQGTACLSNAHYLNAYSLEILVSCGISIDDLMRLSVDSQMARRMVCCRYLHQTLAKIDLSQDSDYEQRFNRIGRYGAFLNVHAADLHALLLQRLKVLQIEVLWSCSVLDVDVEQGVVCSQSTTDGVPQTWHCGAVLSCDGASGSMVPLSGMQQERQDYLDFLTVKISTDIGSYCEDQALFYWIFNEKLTGCLVSFPKQNQHILQIPLYSGLNVDRLLDPSYLKACLADICGASDALDDAHLSYHGRWRLQTSLLSAARLGRVFYLGDCFHQVLPAGGMGLNLAIADAYNLIWKLAADLKNGQLRYALSYEAERMPVAAEKLNQSVANYHGFLEMAKALMGMPDFLFQKGLAQATFLDVDVYPLWLKGAEFLQNMGLDSGFITRLQRSVLVNKSHFDGMAMHHNFTYRSPLVYQATQRCFYDLAVVPLHISPGMRIQNFVCVYQKQLCWVADLLSDHDWTVFIHAEDFKCPVLLDVVAVSHQTYAVLPSSDHSDSLPLGSGFLLVRPDRVVSVYAQCASDLIIDEVVAFLQDLT